MNGTYVECLNWTWDQKLTYIRACIGNEIPHKKLCGHARLSKDEILGEYISAKYIYCSDSGMLSYDGESIESPSTNNKKVAFDEIVGSKKEPRTKEVHEKVELSLVEKVTLLDSGEWLYTKPNGRTHIDLECAKSWSLAALDGVEVYRKVTKPIEWWEDACEHVKASSSDDWELEVANEGQVMRMTAEMTRDQWCDFARILLEQGE